MAIRALPALGFPVLLLAACGDDGIDYPALLPTDQVLAEPSIPGHAQIAAGSPDQVRSDLEAAGQALNVSAAEVTQQDVADEAALEDRAAALRRRAQALAAEPADCATPETPESC
ncbi:hypothetical protein FQV27_02305 [Paracoccus aurantiacus]|uniref:Uncharacterized protein n=1 Tax=Paracoccus aurantiacus TaxID=2599412 RepID=A0A5C6S871_9RHOB|nr:hypothetical protein [Paracoccus aurantiacus]TXB70711.1 hypothetical protein FQV27_02305 [Paracoccus aurantiacus]